MDRPGVGRPCVSAPPGGGPPLGLLCVQRSLSVPAGVLLSPPTAVHSAVCCTPTTAHMLKSTFNSNAYGNHQHIVIFFGGRFEHSYLVRQFMNTVQ